MATFVFQPTMGLHSQLSQNTCLHPWVAPNSFHLPLNTFNENTSSKQDLTYKRWFFCPWIYMAPPSRGSFSFLPHHAFVSGSFLPLKIPSNLLYFPRNVIWGSTNLSQVIYPSMPTSTGMKQNSQLGQAKVLSAIIVTFQKKNVNKTNRKHKKG